VPGGSCADNLDPEAKLKAFEAWEHSDPTYKERVQKRNRCNQIHQYSGAIYQDIAYKVISKIGSELGMDYSVKDGQSPTEDCAKETCVFSYGIQAKDPKKVIFPTFQLTYRGADVTLSIQDRNIDKAAMTITKTLAPDKKSFTPFNLPFNAEDNAKVEKFVRDYFLEKLNNLK